MSLLLPLFLSVSSTVVIGTISGIFAYVQGQEQVNRREPVTLRTLESIPHVRDPIVHFPPQAPIFYEHFVTGQFIKVSSDYVTCMHLAEIIVVSDTNKNISYQKPVIMSSKFDFSKQYDSSNVTDGNFSTYNMTSCGDTPSITVDLLFEANISKIILINRQDCCQQRITGATIEILDKNATSIWKSHPIADRTGSTIPVQDANEQAQGDGFKKFIAAVPYPIVKGYDIEIM